jgi:hypothetical protein
MTQVLDAVRFGTARAGQSATPPVAHALKDAIEMLATAKTVIDQLTEMLHYFTRLGDTGPLRDYREVKANLLRSRALLSAQPDTVALLTEAALRLSKLINSTAVRQSLPPKLTERQSTATMPAAVETASSARPSEPPKPGPTKSSAHPTVVANPAPPRPRAARRGFSIRRSRTRCSPRSRRSYGTQLIVPDDTRVRFACGWHACPD